MHTSHVRRTASGDGLCKLNCQSAHLAKLYLTDRLIFHLNVPAAGWPSTSTWLASCECSSSAGSASTSRYSLLGLPSGCGVVYLWHCLHANLFVCHFVSVGQPPWACHMAIVAGVCDFNGFVQRYCPPVDIVTMALSCSCCVGAANRNYCCVRLYT